MIGVTIRRNSDGETRVFRYNVRHIRGEKWADEDFTSQWGLGNDSCDCNRHLSFADAGGAEAQDHCACGETAYDVLEMRRDGRVICEGDPRKHYGG